MTAAFHNRHAKAAVLSFLLFACAAASNAVMDTLSFRYDKSVFSGFRQSQGWLDPRVSWKNKWKNGDPAQGEAFALSSTALVAATDAWHFFKAVTIACVALAVIVPFTQIFPLHWAAWLGVFVGLKLAYGLIFESLFAHLLIR